MSLQDVFFTNPVTEPACLACCSSVFSNDTAKLGACASDGCSDVNNCFALLETTACLNGRDFRFQGASRVNTVNTKCNEDGTTTVLDNNIFDATVPNQNQIDEDEENICSSCCTDVKGSFDSLGIFDENLCQSVCRGTKNCVDEGDSSKRLGCFVSSDFLVSGKSQFIVNEDGLIVDPFTIQCINGDVSVVVEGIDNGGNNLLENIPALAGIGVGAVVLILIACIFVATRTRGTKDPSTAAYEVPGLSYVPNPTGKPLEPGVTIQDVSFESGAAKNIHSRNPAPSGLSPPQIIRSTEGPQSGKRSVSWFNRLSFRTVSTVDTNLQNQGPNVQKNSLMRMFGRSNSNLLELSPPVPAPTKPIFSGVPNEANSGTPSIDASTVAPKPRRQKRGRNFSKGKYVAPKKSSFSKFPGF